MGSRFNNISNFINWSWFIYSINILGYLNNSINLVWFFNFKWNWTFDLNIFLHWNWVIHWHLDWNLHLSRNFYLNIICNINKSFLDYLLFYYSINYFIDNYWSFNYVRLFNYSINIYWNIHISFLFNIDWSRYLHCSFNWYLNWFLNDNLFLIRSININIILSFKRYFDLSLNNFWNIYICVNILINFNVNWNNFIKYFINLNDSLHRNLRLHFTRYYDWLFNFSGYLNWNNYLFIIIFVSVNRNYFINYSLLDFFDFNSLWNNSLFSYYIFFLYRWSTFQISE